MRINFYATFRQIVGGKTVDLSVPDEITVQQLLDHIILRYPALRRELFDERGGLYPHVHVLIEGRDVQYLKDGLQTLLSPADSINIFPPVAGGAIEAQSILRCPSYVSSSSMYVD